MKELGNQEDSFLICCARQGMAVYMKVSGEYLTFILSLFVVASQAMGVI
jgi:hypothetical protein